MKNILSILAAILAFAAFPALAQTSPTSGSTSGANSSIQNINTPTFVINNPAGAGAAQAQSGSATSAITSTADSTFHTNQAATAATVFVSPPSADTCVKAGNGFSAQGVGAGIGVSIGGGESVKCDMRADTINLKFVGAPAEVIKSRQCMDSQMAEAYARAGLPCVDKRPAAPATVVSSNEPTDALVRARMGLSAL